MTISRSEDNNTSLPNDKPPRTLRGGQLHLQPDRRVIASD